MIGIGLVSLAIATVEHRRSMQSLRAEYGHIVPYSLATLVAALIAALGVLVFLAVVFQQ
jgi:inner membrane protein YidH